MPSRAANWGQIVPCLMLLAALFFCAGCSLSAHTSAAARFDGAPVVQIAAPQPEQVFQAGALLILQARVDNAGPDLARVSVWLDDALLGAKDLPNSNNADSLPLTIDWQTSQPGRFTLSVRAERADGSEGRADVAVQVVAGSSAELPTAPPPDTSAPAEDGLLPADDGINLKLVALALEPPAPVCRESVTITATIQNAGAADASIVGFIGWEFIRLSTGDIFESKSAPVAQSLAAGASAEIPFSDSVSRHHGEELRLRVTIDSDNLVPESNEEDNSHSIDFTLAPGSC